MQDWDLLRAYVDTGSQEAFSQLVERHLDMVYSACLRQVRDTHLAEDATQAAFLILARKARRLHQGVVIAAWLYKVARYTSLNALKMETRRRIHERKAAELAARSIVMEPAWYRLEPLLDEAIAALNSRDRSAVLLRFFERRSYREVGQAIGTSEAAAEMRVSRALDKLRAFFSRKGVILPAMVIGGLLWSNSVHAAPQALLGSIREMACGGNAAPAGSVQVLARCAGRDMAWAAAKVATLACAGMAVAMVVSYCLIQNLLLRAPRPAPPQPQRIERTVERQSFGGFALQYDAR